MNRIDGREVFLALGVDRAVGGRNQAAVLHVGAIISPSTSPNVSASAPAGNCSRSQPRWSKIPVRASAITTPPPLHEPGNSLGRPVVHRQGHRHDENLLGHIVEPVGRDVAGGKVRPPNGPIIADVRIAVQRIVQLHGKQHRGVVGIVEHRNLRGYVGGKQDVLLLP